MSAIGWRAGTACGKKDLSGLDCGWRLTIEHRSYGRHGTLARMGRSRLRGCLPEHRGPPCQSRLFNGAPIGLQSARGRGSDADRVHSSRSHGAQPLERNRHGRLVVSGHTFRGGPNAQDRKSATSTSRRPVKMDLTKPDSVWKQIAPLLEEAMSHLGQTDRDAVVLRFME